MNRLAALLLLLALPVPALADTIDLAWANLSPLYLLNLVPIIAIEHHWLVRRLNLAAGEMLGMVIEANLLSTLFALPVVWICGYILQMVLLSSVGPLRWLELKQVELLLLLLLVPGLYISAKTEEWFYNWKFEGDGRSLVTKAVWEVNLLSFLFLANSLAFTLRLKG